MKYLYKLIGSMVIITGFFSCGETEKTIEFDTAIVDTLIRSEKRYVNYSQRNFNFNDSAIYRDEKDSVIAAQQFFEAVYLHSFFPVRAKSSNQFKLVKVLNWPNKDIHEWVSSHGYWGVGREKLKGRNLLSRTVDDIYGNAIDPGELKNKHVFVKFWFIDCAPCVAEMPELNKIVDEYKDREDVAFISFAIDEAESLEVFLKERPFKYQTISYHDVPEIDSLNITSFPTHLYVKENKIQRVIKVREIRDIIGKL